ncbi:MAG: aminopeptidase P family protein [Mesorhizobium sp.]|uniref:M24 family metallopeptidase n=1 Tax=Mesorhizobium sp. TaxID=1871066 RepID=UPI000FE5076F|nr:Xaa-Pro peptidase family protein [Mesorhizobium sp.]RWI08687.1 MAG: aminopeptidase P family protein [Mesorhizobium sp.]RWM85682.1 MAG: aminopeptidase P family protein [Mesorhizobium sp.]TIO14274.1 MAG: aminopeptidase P family protein [Mesorhizobium sp.]TIP92837.1 MAG: aminopeptidase P family protein [Mesorhizobium sp.]
MSKSDFTAEEFLFRHRQVRSRMADCGLDCIIAFHPVSIHWLTGSDGKSYQNFQCLVVLRDGPLIMLTREPERYEFEQDALCDRLETWGGVEPGDPLMAFASLIERERLAGLRVGMEVPAYYLHPHAYVRVKELLGQAIVDEPCNIISGLRSVKSPAELAYVRSAARVADAGMTVFADQLSAGRTELDLCGQVYHALLASGSELPASTMNLVSGHRSVYSHGAPTRKPLLHGDIGHIEYGAARCRYTATIGRQFSIGRATARQRQIFDVVRRAGDAMIATIRDGVPASHPHRTARKIISEAGLGQYQIHTSGYGLAAGFPPSWGESISMFGETEEPLRTGMVLTIEPPVFNGPEGIGVRLIDNVIVGATGAELLSTFSRDLIEA